MTAKMNSRDRIISSFNHQRPDRPPIDAWIHHEVESRLRKHFGTEDWWQIREELGIDRWDGLMPSIYDAEFECRKRKNPMNARTEAWIDDSTYENVWKVRHKIGDDGRYEQWVAGPLEAAESPEELDKLFRWPDKSMVRDPEDYKKKVAQLKSEDKFVTGSIPNPFKVHWEMRGFENGLMDYAGNPELLNASYDKLYEIYGEMVKRMAAADLDMVCIVGDFAMQDRMMIQPESWIEFDKPRLAKMISDARQIKKDIWFFIHSDGNIMDVMDHIVEIGFDVVNPIQPECMNPSEVKRRWGKRITLHGGISLQKTLPFGNPDDVKKEVENLINSCGRDGGLVVFPSNVLQPDTSTENILTLFSSAKNFRY